MEYLQAFKHDTLCNVYIKCSYVELFDQDGHKVFSLNTPAFDKGAPIGTAVFSEIRSTGSLVPIRISDTVAAILARYKGIIKTTKGAKFSMEALSQRTFYVHPKACNWQPANGATSVVVNDDGAIKEDPGQTGLTKKTRLALAAAALLTLFNN